MIWIEYIINIQLPAVDSLFEPNNNSTKKSFFHSARKFLGSISSLFNMVMAEDTLERNFTADQWIEIDFCHCAKRERERRERTQQLRKDCLLPLRAEKQVFLVSHSRSFPPFDIDLCRSQCWVLMDRDWDKTDFLSSFIMRILFIESRSRGKYMRVRLSFLFLYVSWFPPSTFSLPFEFTIVEEETDAAAGCYS